MRLFGILVLVGTVGCLPPAKLDLTPETTASFGCDRTAVEQEWELRRRMPPRIGESACVLLGRFGLPDHMTSSKYEHFDSMMMTWSGRPSVIASIVYYHDTPVSRRMGYRIGHFVIQSFTSY